MCSCYPEPLLHTDAASGTVDANLSIIEVENMLRGKVRANYANLLQVWPSLPRFHLFYNPFKFYDW